MKLAGEKIIYRADKVHPRFGANFRIMDPLDFVAAVTAHIPDKGKHTVRRYGYYSNRSRGKRRIKGRQQLTLTSRALQEEKELTRSWRQMLKRIYEVDPLICPHCGSRMTIIGFVSDREGIKAVLKSLGLGEEEKPPAWHPKGSESFGDPAPAHPPPELRYEFLPERSLTLEELPVITLS